MLPDFPPVFPVTLAAESITSLNLLSSLNTTQFSNNATTSKLEMLSTYKHPLSGTADKLANIRTITGTNFDGTGNIDISYNNLTNKLTAGNGITIDMTVNPPTISASAGTNYWTKDATTNIYLNQTGNVGIGTTPTTKLHVYEDTTNETKLIIQNNTNVVAGARPTEITVTDAVSTTIGTGDRMIRFPYLGTGTTKDYSFTPTENLICDILVVGGGGGGGKFGGGGGAGAVLFGANIKIGKNIPVSIKVGKGGAGGTTIDTGVNGVNGVDSSITLSSLEYIARGGGGGGTRGSGYIGDNGNDGGSGGGGSGANVLPQGLGGVSNKLTYPNFQSFGNSGGKGRPNVSGSQPIFSSGRGGGVEV